MCYLATPNSGGKTFVMVLLWMEEICSRRTMLRIETILLLVVDFSASYQKVRIALFNRVIVWWLFIHLKPLLQSLRATFILRLRIFFFFHFSNFLLTDYTFICQNIKGKPSRESIETDVSTVNRS